MIFILCLWFMYSFFMYYFLLLILANVPTSLIQTTIRYPITLGFRISNWIQFETYPEEGVKSFQKLWYVKLWSVCLCYILKHNHSDLWTDCTGCWWSEGHCILLEPCILVMLLSAASLLTIFNEPKFMFNEAFYAILKTKMPSQPQK